ncbi:MAG: sugar ABC transporter permease [Spirochaetaceae bacterium]|nr:sugar ABC transporter permease [Spirochaetaceae bacterium]MDT8299026.1 sugar ABC transporter permease [Spirochaetaceae bacterium]
MQSRLNGQNGRTFIFFVFPALLIYSIFVLLPASGGFWYSLTDWNGINPDFRFVGLSNYVEAPSEDSYFLDSILFTLRFVVFMVVLQNGLALLLAVLIESSSKSKGMFRTIFFMPNMIGMLIAGFMWMFVFTKVIPQLSGSLLPGFLNRSWIGDPTWSFYAILVVSLWAGVGYLMVIYIAGLQSVPRQYIDCGSGPDDEPDDTAGFRSPGS